MVDIYKHDNFNTFINLETFAYIMSFSLPTEIRITFQIMEIRRIIQTVFIILKLKGYLNLKYSCNNVSFIFIRVAI